MDWGKKAHIFSTYWLMVYHILIHFTTIYASVGNTVGEKKTCSMLHACEGRSALFNGVWCCSRVLNFSHLRLRNSRSLWGHEVKPEEYSMSVEVEAWTPTCNHCLSMGMPRYSRLVAMVVTCNRSYVDHFWPRNCQCSILLQDVYTNTGHQDEVLAMNSKSTNPSHLVDYPECFTGVSPLARAEGKPPWAAVMAGHSSNSRKQGLRWQHLKIFKWFKDLIYHMQDLDPLAFVIASLGLGSSIWSWKAYYRLKWLKW